MACRDKVWIRSGVEVAEIEVTKSVWNDDELSTSLMRFFPQKFQTLPYALETLCASPKQSMIVHSTATLALKLNTEHTDTVRFMSITRHLARLEGESGVRVRVRVSRGPVNDREHRPFRDQCVRPLR